MADQHAENHWQEPEEVPANQRGFWTKDWQSGEGEATEQIENGTVTVYGDAEEMFADLDGES